MLVFLPRDVLQVVARHLHAADLGRLTRVCQGLSRVLYSSGEIWDAFIESEWLWSRRTAHNSSANVLVAAREYYAFDMHARSRLPATSFMHSLPFCLPRYHVVVIFALCAAKYRQDVTPDSHTDFVGAYSHVGRGDDSTDAANAALLLRRLWISFVFHENFLGLAYSLHSWSSIPSSVLARLQVFSYEHVEQYDRPFQHLILSLRNDRHIHYMLAEVKDYSNYATDEAGAIDLAGISFTSRYALRLLRDKLLRVARLFAVRLGELGGEMSFDHPKHFTHNFLFGNARLSSTLQDARNKVAQLCNGRYTSLAADLFTALLGVLGSAVMGGKSVQHVTQFADSMCRSEEYTEGVSSTPHEALYRALRRKVADVMMTRSYVSTFEATREWPYSTKAWKNGCEYHFWGSMANKLLHVRMFRVRDKKLKGEKKPGEERRKPGKEREGQKPSGERRKPIKERVKPVESEECEKEGPSKEHMKPLERRKENEPGNEDKKLFTDKAREREQRLEEEKRARLLAEQEARAKEEDVLLIVRQVEYLLIAPVSVLLLHEARAFLGSGCNENEIATANLEIAQVLQQFSCAKLS